MFRTSSLVIQIQLDANLFIPNACIMLAIRRTKLHTTTDRLQAPLKKLAWTMTESTIVVERGANLTQTSANSKIGKMQGESSEDNILQAERGAHAG